MNVNEVRRVCDELHEYIELGPGENRDALRSALNAIRKLKAAASWDHPREILGEFELMITAWLSPASSQAGHAADSSRHSLIASLGRLEECWERPSC
jgi:hypothetical protein